MPGLFSWSSGEVLTAADLNDAAEQVNIICTSTTRPGVEALGAYHAKKDEDRQIDLGPEHDWSSHAADAFGLGCVAYEQPTEKRKAAVRTHSGAMGWAG